MKKLGEMVGLHESTISRYEKGEIMSLDIEKMKEFARVLGVNAAWLMGWDDESKELGKATMEVADEIYIPTERLKGYEENKSKIPNKLLERWNNEIGIVYFTDEEVDKLISYSKFLISQRKGDNK